MSRLLAIFLGILALALLVAAGFMVKPAPLKPKELKTMNAQTIGLPQALPAPVERYYRTFYGEALTKVETVVLYGRGKIKPFGIWMPSRFVFIHEAGKNYRHYIEATWFGVPIFKVNEGIIEGVSFFEAPVGSLHNDPNTNQGANLALWAEAGWFPSLWLSDPRVEWKAVDDSAALLFVPYGEERESFIVRFDPRTAKVDFLESMRYREAGEGKKKILWITRNENAPKGDSSILATGSAMWLDQGSPWAYFSVENAIYNADVNQFLRARGN
jgi:hypothetical protein